MKKMKIGIIGGSGIDNPKLLKNQTEIGIETPYGKTSSKIIKGAISGVEVYFLSRHGKKHEIMPTSVPYQANIWALKKLGCTHILATTACGSLREEMKPKDFVFIDQFIDFTKHRNLTFFEDKVVHTPMADPFCSILREKLARNAKLLKIDYHNKGTIVTIEGPRFSTRAESRMFQRLGAEVINMSSVPEVILARELGLCYASIAMVTDYDCWRKDEDSVTWEMIKKVMEHNSQNLIKLILKTIPEIDHSKCDCKK